MKCVQVMITSPVYCIDILVTVTWKDKPSMRKHLTSFIYKQILLSKCLIITLYLHYNVANVTPHQIDQKWFRHLKYSQVIGAIHQWQIKKQNFKVVKVVINPIMILNFTPGFSQTFPWRQRRDNTLLISKRRSAPVKDFSFFLFVSVLFFFSGVKMILNLLIIWILWVKMKPDFKHEHNFSNRSHF